VPRTASIIAQKLASGVSSWTWCVADDQAALPRLRRRSSTSCRTSSGKPKGSVLLVWAPAAPPVFQFG
jgi:hypothetical protein